MKKIRMENKKLYEEKKTQRNNIYSYRVLSLQFLMHTETVCSIYFKVVRSINFT